MRIRKLYENIKEELDEINYLREKIVYPERPVEKSDDSKRREKQKKGQKTH